MDSSEPCPFCHAPLAEGAVACAQCGRDVTFVTVRLLARRLAAAEQRLTAQDECLRALTEQSARAPAVAAAPVHWGADLGWLVLLVAMLLAAHALIVGALDLDTRVLRAASILLPLPFGLRRPLHGWGAALAGLGVGVAAAAGMLETTRLLDGGPFLPENAHDWVEVAQYVACIAFSYFTGSLAGGRWRGFGRSAPLGRSFALALVHGGTPPQRHDALSAAQHVHATAAWINAAMMVMGAVGAIVTALGQLGRLLP